MSEKLDFGRPTIALRPERLRLSWRMDRRSLVVVLILLALTFIIGVIGLGLGSYQLTPGQVLGALLGNAESAKINMLVVEWRLPRLLFAVVCGAALAMSGAMFQSLTRNPLGSPDVIGFSAGSYSGALVVMLVIGSGSYTAIAAGSLIGGAVTALVVYLLAYRGGVQGFRLIIIGIGIGALLGSVNSYLMLIVDVKEAMVVASWGAGSLNALGFTQFWPMFIAFLVLAPLAFGLGGGVGQLELGDDAAQALGSRVERTRLTATLVGVALTAMVTAAAGPISFIALAAPQIARRLTRSSGVELLPSAAVGALLLTGADIFAQQIGVPVGLVTVSIGGVYLIWLLLREYKNK
ncbi:FecCD family ABC transporter permease [Mycetocola spongiae]|uniref:FecCD family ABC transporter permease n=1 Tax=Mycetocola spongiae TaxID=2859226 RepID=UPI001CF4BD97|nr:iron chelate uptake ABC transporter family permease subunit [Mycetocola spongiae]UCR89383.1 iron chelate uptake ABC transporter family permease subunit [Mycetocola spongiae]